MFFGSPDDPSKRVNPFPYSNLRSEDDQDASWFLPTKTRPQKTPYSPWPVATFRKRTSNDLPAGPVKITIAARNSNGGESAPSDPVTATVP
jgi:hypothetical protein